LISRDTGIDAFTITGDHFHLAAMYSRYFRFIDPEKEAVLRAILRDLKGYSIGDISWGFITGTVEDKMKMKKAMFEPGEQMYPVTDNIRTYFSSKIYEASVEKAMGARRYSLDYNRLDSARKLLLKTEKIEEL
jgi:hypothetical protein